MTRAYILPTKHRRDLLL